MHLFQQSVYKLTPLLLAFLMVPEGGMEGVDRSGFPYGLFSLHPPVRIQDQFGLVHIQMQDLIRCLAQNHTETADPVGYGFGVFWAILASSVSFSSSGIWMASNSFKFFFRFCSASLSVLAE